jgi:hypothetical protein
LFSHALLVNAFGDFGIERVMAGLIVVALAVVLGVVLSGTDLQE